MNSYRYYKSKNITVCGRWLYSLAKRLQRMARMRPYIINKTAERAAHRRPMCDDVYGDNVCR